MIITGNDFKYIVFVKARLSEQFLMSDFGALRYFLRIEVSSTSVGFFTSQGKYIQIFLLEHMVDLMEHKVHLCASNNEPLSDPTRCRHLVGSIVYLVITRPDISYPIQILSQFVSAPTLVHYSHLLCVLRYLRGPISRHLFFPRSSSFQLQAYLNAIGLVIL